MRASGTRMFLVLVLCGLFLPPPSILVGQDGVRRVSLAQALEAFGENSLALKIARAETAETVGGARQSRAYSNPSLSFGRDDLGHEGEDYWEETFQLVQQVEWPARTAARGRAAGHAISAVAARFRADSIGLAFAVREAYARAWHAEQTELIVRQTATIIQGVAEDAEIRLEAGDISAYEARRLRLERVQAEQDVAEAALQARNARRTLAALIAPGTGTEEIGPSQGLEGVPPMVSREAAFNTLPGRPDLEAAQRELDAARAGVEIAETYWVPEPTLGLGYRHHLDGFAGASIGVDLPLPFFDRGAGTREEAAARSSAATYRLGPQRRLAQYDLVAATDAYASRRARLETAAEGLLADGDALLLSATAAYSENEATLLELLDAASAFQNSRLSALSLRSEAWIAYYDLLRAMGDAPEDDR